MCFDIENMFFVELGVCGGEMEVGEATHMRRVMEKTYFFDKNTFFEGTQVLTRARYPRAGRFTFAD